MTDLSKISVDDMVFSPAESDNKLEYFREYCEHNDWDFGNPVDAFQALRALETVKHLRDQLRYAEGAWEDQIDIRKDRDELARRLAEAEAELADIREREAACCPEDVGFDEHIGLLKARAEAAEAVVANQAVADISSERIRQISVEGWSKDHDDSHDAGQLARAAACYADPNDHSGFFALPRRWPWAPQCWKPSCDDGCDSIGPERRRDLIKAGALIVAEIERLDRLAARQQATAEPGDRAGGA